MLKHGLLPASLAMANPQALRPCVGLGRPRTPFLHTYAADFARSPDGRWWVIEDRLDAPSGLGYSLQNRIIVRQVLPDSFHGMPVMRLYRFLRQFRESLIAQPAQRLLGRRVSHPGAANETYRTGLPPRYLVPARRADPPPATAGFFPRWRSRASIHSCVASLEFCIRSSSANARSRRARPRAARSAASRWQPARRRALETTALLAFSSRSPDAERTSSCQRRHLVVRQRMAARADQPARARDQANSRPARRRAGALLDKKELAASPTRSGRALGLLRPGARVSRHHPGWNPQTAKLRAMVLSPASFAGPAATMSLPGGLTRCNPSGEEGNI
jgi:hypothetical protein